MSNLATVVLTLYRICTQLLSMYWCCVALAPCAYKQSGVHSPCLKAKWAHAQHQYGYFCRFFYIPCILPISYVWLAGPIVLAQHKRKKRIGKAWTSICRTSWPTQLRRHRETMAAPANFDSDVAKRYDTLEKSYFFKVIPWNNLHFLYCCSCCIDFFGKWLWVLFLYQNILSHFCKCGIVWYWPAVVFNHIGSFSIYHVTFLCYKRYC